MKKRAVVVDAKAASLPGYPAFLTALKARIVDARTAAARSVNRELVSLYWDIGRAVCEKQRTAGWGDAVVSRLARDLSTEYPGVAGFSESNLWRTRQLYADHTSPDFLAQAVRAAKQAGNRIAAVEASVRELVTAVPWGHHVHHLLHIDDPAARLYYLRASANFGWSRAVLLNQIKAGAYERSAKERKTHNFASALPAHVAEQADEAMKSRYSLDFLGIDRAVRERKLEDRLVERLRDFLLELGYGFCFIGRQYRLALGRKEYFVDLLFYNRRLKALVAFDLKVGPFEPEHAGKMDFYLNVLNSTERAEDDRPSIGIVLCAEKNDVEVEFALKTKGNPIGVAEYSLRRDLPAAYKGRLPTARQLADVVRAELPPRPARRPETDPRDG